MHDSEAAKSQFQSTLPVWGATGEFCDISMCREISIHAPRVGSDHVQLAGAANLIISIHAPRVGSDSKYAQKYTCAFVT